MATKSKKFSAQVDAFAVATEKRVNALIRQSTQELIEQAQFPKAKGGRMRVDTGFLRASGQISLTGMPSGPVRGEKKEPDSYEYNDPVALVLTKVKIGSTIFFGWTANYARARNNIDGFLDVAIQNWQAIVNSVAARIKERSPNK